MKVATFRFTAITLAIVIILVGCAILYLQIARPQECPQQMQQCPQQMQQCPQMQPQQCVRTDVHPLIPDSIPSAQTRDRRVLNDPLYPALNRTDEHNFNAVVGEIQKGNLYVDRDRAGMSDSFRIVGYLTNSENERDASNNNNWKLFARMKDRHVGEFYIIPANNNIDLKIPITSDMVIGERLRDIFTLPSQISFKSPMLNTSPYTFTELPKTDFSNNRYL
jgi:hypothetical protein